LIEAYAIGGGVALVALGLSHYKAYRHGYKVGSADMRQSMIEMVGENNDEIRDAVHDVIRDPNALFVLSSTNDKTDKSK
jgi:hypothetical protein